MTGTISAPLYLLKRACAAREQRDIGTALDYLFADGAHVRRGRWYSH